MENLKEDEDVTRIWGSMHNIQTSAKEVLGLDEFKQDTPCFDEECLVFLERENLVFYAGSPTKTNLF